MAALFTLSLVCMGVIVETAAYLTSDYDPYSGDGEDTIAIFAGEYKSKIIYCSVK